MDYDAKRSARLVYAVESCESTIKFLATNTELHPTMVYGALKSLQNLLDQEVPRAARRHQLAQERGREATRLLRERAG